MGAINLSPAGLLVEGWIDAIPARYPYVATDSYVIMPNHIHVIFNLGWEVDDTGNIPETVERVSLPKIVQWFKSATTADYSKRVATLNWPRFNKRFWQRGYHDHIVRSEQSLQRLRDYVEANPSQWPDDEFYQPLR